MRWAELLDRLRGGASTRDRELALTEKRNTWRVFHKILLRGDVGREETLDLVATNFGPGGMRVESATRLKKGQEMRVEVERIGPKSAGFQVQVVWCRHKGEGIYEAGMVFADEPLNNRVAAARYLLEECSVSIQNPREKRGAPRVQTNRMAAEFATEDGEVTQAQVVDLSIGGVQLLSPRRVPNGALLDMRIILGKGVPALRCKGTVVRTGTQGQLRTLDMSVAFTDVPADHKERLVSFLARLLRS